MKRQKRIVKAWRHVVAACLTAGLILPLPQVMAQNSNSFDNYEIRVIRPKYFSKTGRLEVGAQLNTVMNQTFIYSYLASGILDYHINELFAVEAVGAYGFSVEKSDKLLLKQDFDIQTQILRTQYVMDGLILYTPIYGKYQLTSGRLIYFDTFIAAGVGMNGVDYQYDHCRDPNEVTDKVIKDRIPEKPAPRTVNYFGGVIGFGQRFFIDKNIALRYDVRDHIFQYNDADGACDPKYEGVSQVQQNVTIQLGAGYFL